MKIEIDISDLEDIYCSHFEDGQLTGADLKKIIVDTSIKKFIDNMYDDYMDDRVYNAIRNDAKEIIKASSKEIIERVVNHVSEEILRKRAMVDEMPKKSEIANINKEWENYFIELVDKAIAKRFK